MTKKRVFSFLLVLCMLVSLLSNAAFAEETEYEEPVNEELAYEEPVNEEPADEESPYEEPTVGELADEEFADEEPALEEPTVGEPANEEFSDEEPAYEEPAVGEPADEEPTVEEPANEEPADEEPSSEEVSDEEPTDEEPANEEPASEEPTNEEPTVGEPADEEPAFEEPVSEEPTNEEPTVEEPADEEPENKEPADEEPVDEEPAHEESLSEEPDTEVLDFEGEEEELLDAETIEEDSATKAAFETVISEDEEEKVENEADIPENDEDDQELIDSEDREVSAKQEAVYGIAASGTCGDNLTWTLDDAGVLTISGSGAMEDFTYTEWPDEDVPTHEVTAMWWYMNASVKDVIIQNGVTSIGNYAFYECIYVKSITIPASVTSIGEWAFCNSGIKSIVFAGGPPSIDNDAFYGITSDAYYPDNGTWGTGDRQNYGGSLTWKAYNTGSPAITVHPVSKTVKAGSGVIFSVVATGSSLSYQWQVYNASTGKWVDSGIASAKSPTLSFVTNTGHNGLKFRCAVTGGGTTVNSNAATLTVLAITSQPKSVTVASGEKASFSVAAVGSSLSYQWQVYSASAEKWVDSGIASAKTPTLSFVTNTGHNGLKYRCVVTCGGVTVRSNTATLTVTAAAGTITSHPKNVTAVSGNKATFSVTATGSDLSYQWQVYNASNGQWFDSTIASAKTSTLSFVTKAAHNGMMFRCAVTCGGNTKNSNAATLTVLSITSHPKNVTAVNGEKATFSVAATGSSLSYQWQVYDEPTGSWENSSISTAKKATLSFTVNPAHSGLKYRCAVTCNGKTVYSNAATLKVYEGGTCGSNLTWTLDDAGVLTISGSGAMEDFTYTDWPDEDVPMYEVTAPWWYLNEYINNVVIQAGVTSIGDYAFYDFHYVKDITIPASVTSIGYHAFCSSGIKSVVFAGGPPSIDNNAFYGITSDAYYPDNGSWGTGARQNYGGTLTWKAYGTGSPAIKTHPVSKTVKGGSGVAFSVVATGSGLSYQWQVYNASTGKWVDSSIASAKTSTLSFVTNAGHNGLKYRCAVTCGGTTVNSNAATLTVLSITSQPKSVTVTSGNKATFSVAATGSSLSYQWQVYNASTEKWVDSGIASAKTATLSFVTNTGHNGLKYRCAVTCGGVTVHSNPATLTVK